MSNTRVTIPQTLLPHLLAIAQTKTPEPTHADLWAVLGDAISLWSRQTLKALKATAKGDLTAPKGWIVPKTITEPTLTAPEVVITGQAAAVLRASGYDPSNPMDLGRVAVAGILRHTA